ncbi:MAG: hypothetical protein J6P73_00305 [Bacteroidales bacterium]|nr:hypothetical protein [Bacteroidales bacterium]
MKKTLITLVGLLFLLGACKEPTSPVNLFINRADDFGESVSHGTYIMFHIKTVSENDEITRLECECFDSEFGVTPVFDTLFASGKSSVEYDYAYLTKSYITSENMRVKLTFTVHTLGGESFSQVVYFYVTGATLLVTYDQLIMYSGAQSAKANGIALDLVTPIIMQTEDSTRVDVYDYHAQDANPDSLSCEWRSLTGIRFVKFNDFNFPGATTKYLQDSYKAGTKYASVANLCIGDIILVGKEENAIGVFQIQAIYDEDGLDNDRYEVTFKKK